MRTISTPHLRFQSELLDLVEVTDDRSFSRVAYENGWTDGLPVVPPTQELVEQMLAGDKWDPHAVAGTMAPGHGAVTPELVAANAVMAGASTELFAYIWAAVVATLDDSYNLGAIQSTTNPVSPLILVNNPGPLTTPFNASHNCLGSGNHANAVVGRAVSLCLRNIGIAVPGETDMATQGHPGKYGQAFAENEAASPWPPLNADRGMSDSPTVTVFHATSFVNILDVGSSSATELLTTVVETLRMAGSNNVQIGRGELLLVLSPEHAQRISRSGMSKDDVRRTLAQNITVPVEALSDSLKRSILDWRGHEIRMFLARGSVPLVGSWEDICVVVAGGSDGPQSMAIPSFGDGRSVTRTVVL